MHNIETLIYAVGAGRGHTVRGIMLADKLLSEGYEKILVLVREGSRNSIEGLPKSVMVQEVINPEQILEFKAHTLIVDTFANGWFLEFTQSWFNNFARKIFLARYQKDLSWDYVRAHYDNIWLPYSKATNEWNSQIPVDFDYIGTIVKKDIPCLRNDDKSFILYDPEARCSDLFLNRVESLASSAEYSFVYLNKLPPVVDVAKLLSIGAGYNTFYELISTNVDVRFLPIKKKYDDQELRAKKYGLNISSINSLQEWITTGVNR